MKATQIKINNWTVEKISEKEIMISDGWRCCYAFISKDLQKLYFDHVCCPKTVQKRALQFAKKHVKTIY